MDNDGIPRLIFNQVIDLTERFSQAHDLTYTILCYLRGTYLPGVDNITLRGLDFLLPIRLYFSWNISICDAAVKFCLIYVSGATTNLLQKRFQFHLLKFKRTRE